MRPPGALAAAVAVAALGAGTAAGIPSGPAPGVSPLGPPAAWLETSQGDVWLPPVWSRWCTPAAELPPTTPRPPGDGPLCLSVIAALAPGALCPARIAATRPAVHVTPHERVRLHLGFASSAVTAVLRSRPEVLDPATPVLQARGSGPLTILPVTERGDVTYRARLTLTIDTVPPRLAGPRVAGTPGRRFLRVRMSEAAQVLGCIDALDPAVPGQTGERNRAFGGRRKGPGIARLALGDPPPGRHRLFVVALDDAGNLTTLTRTFTEPARPE